MLSNNLYPRPRVAYCYSDKYIVICLYYSYILFSVQSLNQCNVIYETIFLRQFSVDAFQFFSLLYRFQFHFKLWFVVVWPCLVRHQTLWSCHIDIAVSIVSVLLLFVRWQHQSVLSPWHTVTCLYPLRTSVKVAAGLSSLYFHLTDHTHLTSPQ